MVKKKKYRLIRKLYSAIVIAIMLIIIHKGYKPLYWLSAVLFFFFFWSFSKFNLKKIKCERRRAIEKKTIEKEVDPWGFSFCSVSHNQVPDWDVNQLDGVTDDTDSNETNTDSSDNFQVFLVVWFLAFLNEGRPILDKF